MSQAKWSICTAWVILATVFAAESNGDLIVTGVVDGPLPGGTPKAIELFATRDIADLSIYGVGFANNGGGTDGQEFTLSGSAIQGDFLYVASESTGFNTFFGFTPSFTSGSAAINGDDAIELFHSGAVIDLFGDINQDGTGQPWEYLDGWAYRNSGTGPDGTAFQISNWTFSSPNALDGEATNAGAATPFPIGTYQAAVIPEPSVWLLVASGLAALGLCRRMRRKATGALERRDLGILLRF